MNDYSYSPHHDLPVGADRYADGPHGARRRPSGEDDNRPGTTTAAAVMAIVSGVITVVAGFVGLGLTGNARVLKAGYSSAEILALSTVSLAIGSLILGLGVAVLKRHRTSAFVLVALAIPYSIWAIVKAGNAWVGIVWVAVGCLLLVSDRSRAWLSRR